MDLSQRSAVGGRIALSASLYDRNGKVKASAHTRTAPKGELFELVEPRLTDLDAVESELLGGRGVAERHAHEEAVEVRHANALQLPFDDDEFDIAFLGELAQEDTEGSGVAAPSRLSDAWLTTSRRPITA